MPWYGFIHPLLAVAALVYGIRTAQAGMNKVLDWNFPLRRQRKNSIIFFLLCLANFGLGFAVNSVLRGREQQVELSLHWPLAIAVTGLALLAALIPFIRSRRPGEISEAMKIHHWLVIIASVLILTMGFIGLLKAFGL